MKLLSIVKNTLNKILIYRINPKNFGTRVIAVIILTAIMFTFLHSELGLLDFDGHNHGTHDYCEIAKNTNSHSNTLRVELPKLDLNKDICFHCFEKVETQAVQTSFEITGHHLKAKPFTDLYLFNRTFLI